MRQPLNYLTASMLVIVLLIASCAPTFRTVVNFKAKIFQGTPEEIAKVENLNIAGSEVQIPLRIYTPEGSSPFPILVFMHGGGWVTGNLDTCDNICRFLANRVGCIVISVDYRLAPKHKFPAAVEDVYSAVQWVAENVTRINGDPNRIAVGGVSAGGNLAAVVCLMSKHQNGPSLVFQLLAFPATNLASLETDSYRDFGKGYGLTKSHVKWFRKQYLNSEDDRKNPYVSPLLADDLTGLPPALIITGKYDVARDDGKAYATRLKQEGVSVRYKCFAGGHMAHWGVKSDRAGAALHAAVSALSAAFSKCSPNVYKLSQADTDDLGDACPSDPENDIDDDVFGEECNNCL
ncbi:MAG: alpha/beta hydrolase [Deltaproteobacteria bacterium]|nr:alpha/beta hydrolase [Deltaproteobacteria bacterium]